MNGIGIAFSPAMLEQLVEQVAERVRAEVASGSPWMTRQAAAVYLGVPVSRLEKDRTAPSHRWDGRVLYNRQELDSWLLGMLG